MTLHRRDMDISWVTALTDRQLVAAAEREIRAYFATVERQARRRPRRTIPAWIPNAVGLVVLIVLFKLFPETGILPAGAFRLHIFAPADQDSERATTPQLEATLELLHR